jgi:hypothetical protein
MDHNRSGGDFTCELTIKAPVTRVYDRTANLTPDGATGHLREPGA